MKRLFQIVLAAALLFTFTATKAQLHVNVNIGTQPVWGPVGYDHVDYYYLPDIDMYYYVPRHQYVYWNDGRWVFASRLPYRYHNYDVYHSYKVVVNEPRPYLHHDADRIKYAKFRGHHDQDMIRDSRDEKYFVNKDHPEHERWRKDHEHDRDHDHERH